MDIDQKMKEFDKKLHMNFLYSANKMLEEKVKSFLRTALEDMDMENKILSKKLEMSKLKEKRLRPDHRGKRIGKISGCVACDAERHERNRKSLRLSEEEVNHICQDFFDGGEDMWKPLAKTICKLRGDKE